MQKEFATKLLKFTDEIKNSEQRLNEKLKKKATFEEL